MQEHFGEHLDRVKRRSQFVGYHGEKIVLGFIARFQFDEGIFQFPIVAHQFSGTFNHFRFEFGI